MVRNLCNVSNFIDSSVEHSQLLSLIGQFAGRTDSEQQRLSTVFSNLSVQGVYCLFRLLDDFEVPVISVSPTGAHWQNLTRDRTPHGLSQYTTRVLDCLYILTSKVGKPMCPTAGTRLCLKPLFLWHNLNTTEPGRGSENHDPDIRATVRLECQIVAGPSESTRTVCLRLGTGTVAMARRGRLAA